MTGSSALSSQDLLKTYLAGGSRHLEGIILSHKGNELANVNVGGVNGVVVEANIRGDRQVSIGSGASSQDVQKTSLAGTTGSHDGCSFVGGNFPPDIAQELLFRFSGFSRGLRGRSQKYSRG